MSSKAVVQHMKPAGQERFHFNDTFIPEWVTWTLAIMVVTSVTIVACGLLSHLDVIWVMLIGAATFFVSSLVTAGYVYNILNTAISFDWDNNRVVFENCYRLIPMEYFPCMHHRSFAISDIYSVHTTSLRNMLTVYIFVGFGGCVVRSNLTDFDLLLERLSYIQAEIDKSRG
ncbi:MAG: hypothetical protein ACIAQ0_01965 [Phycisphaerales bacterium JB058]